MKDAYYFFHDSNASTDHKIVHMRSQYGWEGYGLYWAIIERLRDIEDHKYPLNRIEALAFDLQMPDITQFINKCILEFALFETDEECFWSESLLRRMAKLEANRAKRKHAAEVRWGKDGDNASAMQMQSTCKALEESRVEEKRVEKSREEKQELTQASTEVAVDKLLKAEADSEKEDPKVPLEKIPERYKVAADILSSEFAMDLRLSDLDVLEDLFKNNYPSTVYASLHKLKKKSDEKGKPPPERPIAYIHTYMKNWTKKTKSKEQHPQVGIAGGWTCKKCGAVNTHSGMMCIKCREER